MLRLSLMCLTLLTAAPALAAEVVTPAQRKNVAADVRKSGLYKTLRNPSLRFRRKLADHSDQEIAAAILGAKLSQPRTHKLVKGMIFARNERGRVLVATFSKRVRVATGKPTGEATVVPWAHMNVHVAE